MSKTDKTETPLPKSTESFEALLSLFKASSDQMRVKVLHLLNKDSYGVLELCNLFDCKQPTMSHHLKTLSKAGLVSSRREGSSIYYQRVRRPADDEFEQLQQSIFAAIDKLPVPPPQAARIELIKQDRAEDSRRFFTENFEKISQQQAHVASYDLYSQSTLELIEKYTHSFAAGAKVLEIGPGDGDFLTKLSPLFKEVYALDNAKPMLEAAQSTVAEHKLSNIHFIEGDTQSKQLEEVEVDVAVTNMVLHHIPSPAKTFVDVAKHLPVNGQFFISELCNHNQDWVKESVGDLWMGFDPDDISQWAKEAGFSVGDSIYLTQRNGFRIQIRQFIKTA
ncbi:ArsR/SmtB family transcription factor [Oceanicoccus sagamiensis]|uniref:HTH arsR-type domain-containing protein n=1 Tax=Oceanicoccus sagamiensis TaxID=716816 RepID=A0A1X9N7S3_9GAMM|nr:metalloregulator ArsR/SmtB family transcription factor [Oceanicoccus sagamiensis]ARN73164.1 hypothetical protein BST96_03010 [Oceanicoccus sagamiensis]